MPKGARGLVGSEADGYVYGLARQMRAEDGSGTWPLIMLMSDERLRAIEAKINDDPELDPAQKQRRIMKLSGGAYRMSIDAQNRIVLPAHFVQHLRLERDVYCFSTNQEVMVWNPADYQAYLGDTEDDDLDAFF